MLSGKIYKESCDEYNLTFDAFVEKILSEAKIDFVSDVSFYKMMDRISAYLRYQVSVGRLHLELMEGLMEVFKKKTVLNANDGYNPITQKK